MRRKDRIRVQCHTVPAPFASFELDVGLLRRAVLRTQEARPLTDGLLVQSGLRGDSPARIILNGHLQSADLNVLYLGFLEVTVILSGHRPDRKLILYEFVDLSIHQSNASKVSLIDLNSCSKFGVNSPMPRFASISAMSR